VRGRDVADVHVVAHVRAVGGVVVVAVDLRGLAGEGFSNTIGKRLCGLVSYTVGSAEPTTLK
jgi:hypothetical protein